MQFSFLTGRGTTDAIFILRELQEKYLDKAENLYFVIVDLEKASDQVPEILFGGFNETRRRRAGGHVCTALSVIIF